jgi:hypothetical protein
MTAIAQNVGHIAFAGFAANFAAVFFAFANRAGADIVSAFISFVCHNKSPYGFQKQLIV